MRYITKKGINRFTSLKRRSGRYLFITLRNQTSAVKIRHIGLIESTYPVNEVGRFNCSDTRLDKIWEISARTLKLCMEDTFTDCPLYEQTFWVGDARNEALFAYSAFGATDLVRNGLTLAAQSLEHYPMVGSQVPTNWKSILPAWGFLWGIAVWDYYFYSGDTAFIAAIFPAVLQNIEGAEKMLDEHGLLSGNYWNMFDWTGADQEHETVTHNTQFFIGAIDAALKCADVLGDAENTAGLKKLRAKLKRNVNALWDDKKNSYPDSIHADGTISPSTCQHTSFLSILYDIVEKKNHAAALNNVLNKPEGMVGIGSPFALLYLYEMMDMEGLQDKIIESIYHDFEEMLRLGATTVWEQLRDTRSHAHAWSSSPIYFLNRIILGVRQTEPGGTAFEISPMPNGLDWADGAVATPHGPLQVQWELSGRNMKVDITAPAGAEVTFKRNKTLKGLKLEVEIRRC
jgi:alpha-L-rhamnosidase